MAEHKNAIYPRNPADPMAVHFQRTGHPTPLSLNLMAREVVPKSTREEDRLRSLLQWEISPHDQALYADRFVVDVIQKDHVKTAEVGQDVKLNCYFSNNQISNVAWFKQTVGQKPIPIASSYHRSQTAQFFNGFDKSKRFNVSRGLNSFDLHIFRAEPSDSGTYYCVITFLYEQTFGEGTILIVEGAKSSDSAIQQLPISTFLQTGENVNLQCTVPAEICAGEHSVYWFRQGSGESHPGIIYTRENRSDQCEKRSEAGSPTQSCVYHLPKRNISSSDAGTYYCAVATCGQILYGNGTQLLFQAKA
ncbi:immunoglobulin alpha-2 heavy chain-like [Chanos chanos]|uniref:immunoglobulin alpha-2 heavy chain-like n=1 Tax=Chanos chanos TaxID=29144 RepID=UPI0011F3AB33|nr:immunoglobulin alpha-2 heavy chain-like [Chanos chanos]